MSKYGLDKVLLGFLCANIGSEFRIEDFQEQLGPSLQAKLISQALLRLSKRKLVSRRMFGEGKNKQHYWMLRTNAKNIQTQEVLNHDSGKEIRDSDSRTD